MSTTVDFEAIKARQQETWASGDYSTIGTTLQIVGEQLCETVDVAAHRAQRMTVPSVRARHACVMLTSWNASWPPAVTCSSISPTPAT